MALRYPVDIFTEAHKIVLLKAHIQIQSKFLENTNLEESTLAQVQI